MKFKTPLLVLFVFSCLHLSAQQANQNHSTTLNKKQSVSTTELKAEIQQLQSDNQELREQLKDLEKEVDFYRGDIRQKAMELDNLSSSMNDNLSHWLTVLSIIMTLVIVIPGVVIPLILNANQSKRLKEDFFRALNKQKTQVDAQIESVSVQAKKAEGAVKTAEDLKTEITYIKEAVAKESEAAQNAAKLAEDLKRQFTDIQKKITKESKSAEKAATQAEASRFFTEALSEEDPSKRVDLYTKAIELKPDYAPAFNNRGIAKYDLGNYQDAIKDYDKAIELNPGYAIAFNNRGNAKQSLGNYQDAIKDYNKAIELNPDYAMAFNNRGETKTKLNDFKDALEDFNTAIKLKSRALYYRNRAKLYRTLAEMEKDDIKKNELLSKAEADEKMADSM